MEFFKTLTLTWKRVIAASAGLIAGYAYYYYIGCASGTCPITGNPYISSLYGAVVGLLLVPSKKSGTRDDAVKSDPS